MGGKETAGKFTHKTGNVDRWPFHAPAIRTQQAMPCSRNQSHWVSPEDFGRSTPGRMVRSSSAVAFFGHSVGLAAEVGTTRLGVEGPGAAGREEAAAAEASAELGEGLSSAAR